VKIFRGPHGDVAEPEQTNPGSRKTLVVTPWVKPLAYNGCDQVLCNECGHSQRIFLKKYFSNFDQKFRFLSKNSIFVKNFDLCQKIRFVSKNSIFVKKIRFLSKNSIFVKKFDFCQKFRFLSNCYLPIKAKVRNLIIF